MMSKTVWIAISLISLLYMVTCPLLFAQDRITLRDGTVIGGELLRLSGDTLFFKTSFSDELPIGREKIRSIEFDVEAVTGTSPSPGTGEPSGTGKLAVVITGPELITSIRFRRGNEMEEAVEANKIVFRISVDGEVLYEQTDEEIETETRSEGWTILKNKFQYERYEIPLPAGEYLVSIYVGNDLSNEYRQKYNSGSVGLSKTRENVRLFDDQVTTLVLKSKQPFLNLGNYDLEWVE
jgi:hypothetical protein